METMLMDHAKARRTMVDCQVRTVDVTNPELLDALLSVPRENFVPAALAELAYLDEELPLAGGRKLLASAPFAKLLQAASVQPGDNVLDVGCASGYSTAVISKLCGSVTGLEVSPALAHQARNSLEKIGIANAKFVEGPLNIGHKAGAPYDVIFIGGSVGVIPQALLGQLANGGRLVVVEGSGNAAMASLYVNRDGDISGRRLFNSAIAPLPGFERRAGFVF